MDVIERYKICDRCKNKIKESWYKRGTVIKLKERFFVNGYVTECEHELCGSCTEKFERFMNMLIDDDAKTEHDRFYEDKNQ
ncbi:hypothetical protein MHB73_21290 [Bacillus sp. FSL K6-6483]